MAELREALAIRQRDHQPTDPHRAEQADRQAVRADPDAVASFQQALELQPDLADVQLNLGHALREQGRLDEAATSYQQALRLKPDDPEVRNNRALSGTGQANFRREYIPDPPTSNPETLLPRDGAANVEPGGKVSFSRNFPVPTGRSCANWVVVQGQRTPKTNTGWSKCRFPEQLQVISDCALLHFDCFSDNAGHTMYY